MEQLQADIKPFKSCLQPTLFQLEVAQADCRVRSVLFLKSEDGSFRELSHPTDFFTTRSRIVGKILTFTQPTTEKMTEVDLPRSKSTTQFELPFEHGKFVLLCRILNTTQEETTPAMMLTPLAHVGYDKFLEYRRKVKRLENITSPLNWQVAHRIRVLHHLQTYIYDMDDINEVCIDSSLDSQLTFELQEQCFISPQNRLSEVIATCIVTLKQNNPSGSFEISIKLSQYLTIRFSVERVMTELKQQEGLISIRVLETPSAVADLKLGLVDDQTLQIQNVQSLNQIATQNGKIYFDPQYFFLERNLKSIEGSEQTKIEAVDQLSKLTPAFPAYPHIKNQQLLPLNSSVKYLCLTFKYSNGQSESFRIPIYDLLIGLNSAVLPSLETGSKCMRFYIEVNKTIQQECTKKHRVFSLYPQTIWNAFMLPDGQNLSVKIVNNNTVLKAQFKLDNKDMGGADKDVKRELQKLESRNQLQVDFQKSKFIVSKVTSAKQSSGSFKVIEPPVGLDPEGLIINETLFNERAHVQICLDEDIVAFGSFSLKDLTKQGAIIVPLISTAKESENVFVIFGYKQRERAWCKSAARLYKLAYSMTTLNPNADTLYELHLVNLQKTTKQFKQKIEPGQTNNSSGMKQIDFVVFSKTKEAELSLLIRRRYYDDLTESYSYHEYLSKNISFNNDARITDSSFDNVNISDGAYEVLTWEFFAEDALQHVTFKLQVGCLMDESLDATGKGNGYSIKLLPLMWNKLKNGLQQTPSTINFEVVTNKRAKVGLPRVKDVNYMNCMEFSLRANDYRDGISLVIDSRSGYSKVYNLIKIPVNVSKNDLDLEGESQFCLTCLSIDGTQLLFLLRRHQGAGNQSSEDDAKSNKSAKTVGKERQHKGDKRDVVDDFNKTIRLNDVLQLKSQINKITLENRQLVTKVVRMQNTNSVLQQKLAEIKQIAERKKEQLKVAAVSRPTHDKFADPVLEEVKEKKRKLYRQICGCGAKHPKYMQQSDLRRGYCEDCLKELEKTYRLIYQQFEEKAKQYENTFYRNMLHKEKTKLLEDKIRNIKDRLLMRETEENARNESDEAAEQRTLNEIKEKLVQLKNTAATFRIRIDGVIQSGGQLQETLEGKINSENRVIFDYSQKIAECRRRNAEIQAKIASLTTLNQQQAQPPS